MHPKQLHVLRNLPFLQKQPLPEVKVVELKRVVQQPHWKTHLQYPMLMMKMRTSKKRTLKAHREKEAQREKEIQRKGCKSQRQGDASQ